MPASSRMGGRLHNPVRLSKIIHTQPEFRVCHGFVPPVSCPPFSQNLRSGPVGDIFREVDEELKQERYEKLWREYRWYIIGAAVAVVAAVAGWQAWNAYQTNQRHAEGQRFAAAAALLLDGKSNEAADAFSSLARGRVLRLRGPCPSSTRRRSRPRPEMRSRRSRFTTVSRKIRPLLRPMQGLATVLAALQALKVPSIGADAIRNKIQPMSTAGRPYRHVRAGDTRPDGAKGRGYRSGAEPIIAPSSTTPRPQPVSGPGRRRC